MSTAPQSTSGGQGVHPSQLMAITPNSNLLSDEVKFKVRDTTATSPRTHVMLDDKGNKVSFTFPNDHESIDVPYQYALKFARIPEFHVTDPNGRLIRAVPQRRGSGGIQLNGDECIAKLEELTNAALLVRCQNAGGSQNKNTPKPQLIAFLQQMSGMRVMAADEAAREEAEEKEREREERAAKDAVRPGNGIAENEVELESLN